MRRLLLAACLTVAAACASYQQKENAARDIDRFGNTVLREIPDLPSVGVAAVMNGRVVYVKNGDTPYYIGSTTKAYTGLAMAMLAKRGVIDLDAPVSKYLPGTNLNVTLRAFLTHTSGVSNEPIVFRTAFSGEHTHDQLVSLLDQSKPIKPGFRYDNLGYVVASLVIEQVTGKPWQQVLDRLAFRPLGMTHTTAYMSVAKRWKMPQPYWRNRAGEVVPLTFEKVDETMHAAGGIVTTPFDLARWLQANLSKNDGAFDEALRMQVPVTIQRGDFKSTGYAFGWYHADFHGQYALFHGGGYDGWHSQFAMLPEKNIGVGVMTNVNGTPVAGADLIVEYALDRLSGRKGLDAEYAPKIAAVKDRVAKARQALIEDIANRAQRPWSLPHPNSSYVGRYEHPGFGTLTIEERDGKLYASIGRLSSVIEAFTRPETARVEMTPGSGEPLVFKWSSGDKPDAVVWTDDTFNRVK